MIESKFSSKRWKVQKKCIIDSTLFSNNDNCCGNDEKNVVSTVKKKTSRQTSKSQERLASKAKEYIIEIPKQKTVVIEEAVDDSIPLFYELMSNAWPKSNERVENLAITQKRCEFSNEAISIKPVTAIPGIGKKYGQILANHGFIYARQLLGYYLILKDNEMFRKWLQYQFQISKFRAAEITSALNEMIRRTL